jgi:hypothetical protein
MNSNRQLCATARVAIAALTLCGSIDTALGQALQDVGCAGEDGFQSKEGPQSTQITFINRSDRPVRTYWLNYQGKRVFYSEIAPGRSYVQQTYVTHPWVITNDRSGNCIALFLPASFPATAVIR